MSHINKALTLFAGLFFIFAATLNVCAQTQSPSRDGVSLAPARYELEMTPGSETTVVVNLNYRTANNAAQSFRIVASLNDWTINRTGRVEYFKAGTQPNSASSWMIYSPGEVTVQPGNVHSIRVTIAVPKDATPGDHLAALVVEPRADNIKSQQNERQVLVRYRMASMFYIKVPQLTRRGSLQNLQAAATADTIQVTPTIKNEGNSVIRPLTSIIVTDAYGRAVAELPEGERTPLLGASEQSQPLLIEKALPPGAYSVKYRVDFQDGGKVIEGITDFSVKETAARKPASTATAGQRN
jgi:hypothetical protein